MRKHGVMCGALLVFACLDAILADGKEEHEQELEHTFKSLDADGDGYLKRSEMEAWLKSEDEELSHEDAEKEIAAAFDVFDHNRDDKLDSAEFAQSMAAMDEDGEHMHEDHNHDEENDEDHHDEGSEPEQ
eukprot:TRINITY_DN41884_c0_g1_i1.p1 TRINITY_DN41884_c0_g1~~TRINITY_DN41884_c0_g1_i1.p1  ORF type:complete len:130 (+),score=36.35 TRINITY_DN41884_c0_g1_i1:52-441(+)